MSALPSPLKSPAATRVPPRWLASKAKKLLITEPSAPLKVVMRGPPPTSAPTITSPNPSPSTSPTATQVPPRKVSSKAKKLRMTLPVAPSNTIVRGPPPMPVVVTISAMPSPFTSPCATRTPPTKDDSYGDRRNFSPPVA